MAGKANQMMWWAARCRALWLDKVEFLYKSVLLVNMFSTCKEIGEDVVCRFDLPYPPGEILTGEDEESPWEVLSYVDLKQDDVDALQNSVVCTQLPKVTDQLRNLAELVVQLILSALVHQTFYFQMLGGLITALDQAYHSSVIYMFCEVDWICYVWWTGRIGLNWVHWPVWHKCLGWVCWSCGQTSW